MASQNRRQGEETSDGESGLLSEQKTKKHYPFWGGHYAVKESG